MSFLYPAFLFALFAVLIPVVIHLFSFRRYTTVYFSHVGFLRNIRQESEKKSRLKQLLILLARIMALASLVLMFAQPYIPVKNQRQGSPLSVVGVYVDNSFSMTGQTTGGQLLEVARSKALEIAGAYPADTRFMVATNDLLTRHLHIFNREQFIREVSEIGLSPRSVPLSQVRARLVSAARRSGEDVAITIYYLSDFQTRTTDLEGFRGDTSLTDYLYPVIPGSNSNLYIDSCWMEFPAHRQGQEEKLMVKIINRSAEGYQNLPVKFFLNDTLKAPGNFNIDAAGEAIVPLKFVNLGTGLQKGHVEISDYPFVHDNTFFLSYMVQPSLRVLAVSGSANPGSQGSPYLRALFGDDDYVDFEEANTGNLRVSSLGSYNTIFLVNIKSLSTGLVSELHKAAENGTTVVFFPEPDGDTESYNRFLQTFQANRILRNDTTILEIAAIEWEHPVYDQVFRSRTEQAEFPRIRGSFRFSRDVRIPETPLLWFRSGEKACSSQPIGNGNLVVFSFPLSSMNDAFARDMLFVPTLYGVVINLLPGQKIHYTIGRETTAILPAQALPGATPLTVTNEDSGQEFIPASSITEGHKVRIHLGGNFTTAGHYLVRNDDETVAVLSMNYDRNESDTECYLPGELRAETGKYQLPATFVIDGQEKEFSLVYNEIKNGKRLWQLFLVGALLFLLAEALIIRFWK